MIYIDNSATTYPKPPAVISACQRAMKYYGFNSGRGGYNQSVAAAAEIFPVREKASALTGAEAHNIAFTQNCTLALNMAIKGLARQGDHILISNLEHNAVARPVDTMARRGIISYDVFEFDYDIERLLNNIRALINSKTRMIICTQASNVFGCIIPLDEIGSLAAEEGLIFICDGAQGAGIIKTDCARCNITAYCAAGHKGLYGPMATGFIALGGSALPETIIEGGTGSASLMLAQPSDMPDRLESGTLDNSGIIGLGAGIDFVRKKGVEKIYAHELEIVSHIYRELAALPDAALYTPAPKRGEAVPILSFNYKDFPSEKTARLLAKSSVAVRAGLHCAPLAHRAFGTEERGTVRISPSVFSPAQEM